MHKFRFFSGFGICYSEAGFWHSCPCSHVQQHGVIINAVCSRAAGVGSRAAEKGLQPS